MNARKYLFCYLEKREKEHNSIWFLVTMETHGYMLEAGSSCSWK